MKKIAILSALGREIKFIKDNIQINSTKEIKGYRFSQGSYKDLEIILGITSVGKVNAALCTEILINNFNPQGIINTGIAGAVNLEASLLDIVVSEQVFYHDVEEYILRGVYPFTGNFKCDELLLIEAKKAAAEMELKGAQRIIFGKTISGDSFISCKEEKKRLVDMFNPVSVEMEGAAIAHTCYINKVPFISVRSISDKADDSAKDSYKENEIPAANEAGKFVLYLLDNISNLV